MQRQPHLFPWNSAHLIDDERSREVGFTLLVSEDQIADAMVWNKNEVKDVVLNSPIGKAFRASLFKRVVPNLKRLGLLTPRVREAFSQLDIIQFENADPEAEDRQLGLA